MGVEGRGSGVPRILKWGRGGGESAPSEARELDGGAGGRGHLYVRIIFKFAMKICVFAS